ncbi:MAG: hypothetical protein CMF25_04645 [Kangiellaceae bacterium]|nr:hypothetical protein [Kangiellaceae bacterium]|tara:strand:- start:3026 stop:4003 length:978 start_codon:yes stop_codon:yes gene_type:complete
MTPRNYYFFPCSPTLLCIFGFWLLTNSVFASDRLFIKVLANPTYSGNLTALAKQDDSILAVGEYGAGVVWDGKADKVDSFAISLPELLTGVKIQQDGNILAYGHAGVIYQCVRPPAVWKQVYQYDNQIDPILSIEEVGTDLIAVGAYGLFLRSQDRGHTWHKEEHLNLENPDFGFPHFYQISMLNHRLWLVGEAGLVASSNDNGQSWQVEPLGYDGSMFSVAQWNGTIYIAGLRGSLYKQQEQGWVSIDTPFTNSIFKLLAVDDALYALGADGLIAKMVNGKFLFGYLDTGVSISDALIVGDSQLVLATTGGLLTVELNEVAANE